MKEVSPNLPGETLRTRPRDADTAASVVASFSSRPLSFLGPAVLGFVLWSVVSMSPLEIELASGARPPIVLLHLQPLLVLALGLLFRSPVFLLAAFPLALMLTFFGLEPLDLMPLNSFRGVLTLASALVLYLVGTARLAPRRGDAPPVLTGERLLLGVDRRYRRIARATWPRLALLVALVVVPLLALYRHEGQVDLTEHYGTRAKDAVLLVHTVHLFVAVLAGYLFFLSPAVNASYETQELRDQLAGYRHSEKRTRAFRALAVYLVLGAVFVALWVVLKLRT